MGADGVGIGYRERNDRRLLRLSGSGSPLEISMTLPAVAGMNLHAGDVIVLGVSITSSVVFQTTNNGAINTSATSFLLNGACSSFLPPPFDVKPETDISLTERSSRLLPVRSLRFRGENQNRLLQ